MNAYSYDLHIHSCLSPCGDNDSTPASIAGIAVLNGLRIAALTDHNTTRNCPAFCKAARAYGLIPIPGMELSTAEDIHVVCLFPTLELAMSFNEIVRDRLIRVKNDPEIFGDQLVMDEDDNVIREEDALLIGATDLSLEQLSRLVREAGGVPVPAHINRGSNGLLVNLGMMPPDIEFTAVEVWRALPCPHTPQEGRVVLHSSDAHYLGDILEPEITTELEEPTVAAFLEKLRRGA